LIYKAFFDNEIGVPVDLLTIDYNRYIELNNEIGYIYKKIKEEGKVIYGKQGIPANMLKLQKKNMKIV